MELLAKIGSIILAPILALGQFLISPFTDPLQERIDNLEAQLEQEDIGRTVNPVAGKTYTLYGGGIDSDDTSVTLTSFTIPVSGAQYTMSHFGSTASATGYLTIEPGSATRQEFISFTGITDNSDDTVTLTGVQRGLAPVYPYTASTTYAKTHSGGSVVVISNPPQLYEAIYSYIDNASSSGAVDAAPTIKGLVEVATGAEAASSTAIGGGNTSAPLVLSTTIATSTSPSSGNVVVVTHDGGNIDGTFIQNVEGATFTGTTTFSSAVLGVSGSSTMKVYTATSTWTRPEHLRYIIVEVVGGGGGGGPGNEGAPDREGAGGGAGGYSKELISTTTLAATTSVQIVIGTGGTGGTGNTDGSGTAGDTSKFGTFLSASGGGAASNSNVGATGGVGSNGDINITGASGMHSGPNDSGIPGRGGASFYGMTYGGGGDGGLGSSNANGGNGTNGIVIVYEYF